MELVVAHYRHQSHHRDTHIPDSQGSWVSTQLRPHRVYRYARIARVKERKRERKKKMKETEERERERDRESVLSIANDYYCNRETDHFPYSNGVVITRAKLRRPIVHRHHYYHYKVSLSTDWSAFIFMAADLDLKSERGVGGHRGPQRKSFVLPIRVNRVPTGWLGDACLLWEGKGRIRERMKNWITISNDFIRRNRIRSVEIVIVVILTRLESSSWIITNNIGSEKCFRIREFSGRWWNKISTIRTQYVT